MNERPSVINLTAADRAAMGDDGHDTPFVGKSEMTLVYAASPEVLVGGPSFVPGAQVGGYAVSQGDKRIAFNNGVLFHPIGFRLSHPEYGPDVGDKRGQYLRDHGVARPDAAVWRDADGFQIQKAGYYLPNGNAVVPTVTAYGLVNGFGVGFAMYRTAYNAGKDLVIRAERLRVKADIDGKTEELRGCTLGVFKFTSAFEKRGPYTVPIPVATLVGRLGEEGGPTLAAWRKIQPLRRAFKEGGDWTPIEAFDPPAPPELGTSRQGSVTVNDMSVQRSEANPPPIEDGGADWEIDDLDL